MKEWAYAGFFFDLTAAAFSRASVGDATADVIAPLGFLALVMISWWLRPANRTLPSQARPVRSTADTTYVNASPLVQRAHT